MTLLETKLREFNDTFNDKVDLDKKFEELARYFLYSGYLKVNDSYLIELVSVEFYFHAEADSKLTDKKFKDPIVYHRNGRFGLSDVPYLPIMSLNPHSSGFDITFENEDMKYRASALIREYKVMKLLNNNQPGKIVFLDEKHKNSDDRSTFLYYYLCGFAIGENNANNKIEWVDKLGETKDTLKDRKVESNNRQNVFAFDEEASTDSTKPVFKDGRILKDGTKREKKADDRLWKFSRV